MKKTLILCFILVIFGLGLFLYLSNRDKPDLEGFYDLTLKDPLFYSPFFEAEEFEKAIGGLEKTEKEFRRVIIENTAAGNFPQKYYYIQIFQENTLFPFQFLKQLSSINQKTKELIENPSVGRAKELLNLYDRAADAYLREASTRVGIFEKIKGLEEKEGEYHNQYFFFVDSATSIETVKNDFLLIQNNGYKLKEEVQKRKNCLLGKTPCWAPSQAGEVNGFIESLEANFELKGKNVDSVKDSLPNYSIHPIEVRGPYKTTSSCWQNPASENWLYLIYPRDTDKNLIIAKLANQSYYYKINHQINHPIQRALSEKGLDFCDQLETTYYECMDLTFYPRLLVLDFLKKRLETGITSKEELTKELNYELLAENQFGLMAPAINLISEILESRKNIQILTKEYPSAPAFIFSIETSYSIFYFPFAKSIWRINEQPQYAVSEDEIPVNKSPQFITLNELERLGYSEKEIKNFQVNFAEFVAALVEEKEN